MQCVNHPGVDVQSYCQNCGKALCAQCVRTTPSGQILCEQCLTAGAVDPNQAFWQAAQAYVTSAQGVPNPSAAAVLGLIPGVGAMYNGQLFKGLIHVVIFAVLVSMTENYGLFGIFVGAWVLYQSFEAYQTAKARRDGLPLPDPFGLNELGGWLNLGGPGRYPKTPPVQTPPPGATEPGAASAPGAAEPGSSGAAEAASAAGTEPPAYGAPYTPPYTAPPYTPPYTAPYTPPNTPPYTTAQYTPPGAWGANPPPGYTATPYGQAYPGANPDPYAGSYPPGYVPPVPPIPLPPHPPGWRGREPAWAVILIVLGLVFLLKTVGVVGHLFHFAWPVLLIGFGVWMILRRVGYKQGGPK